MPENDVTTSAAPSAATETPNPYAAGKLTPAISKQFLEKAQGKDQPKTADTATADTSKETKSGAKAESAADTDTAKEQQEKGSRRKPSAEERIAELVAENKRLKEKQAPAAKEAESATAKPVQKQPEALTEPKEPIEPNEADFANWDDYRKAEKKYQADLRQYTKDLAKYESQKAVLSDRQQRKFEADQAKFNEYLGEAVKRYPGLKETLPPFTKELESADPAVQLALNRSENLADVLMVICEDADTKAQFLNEAKTDPLAAIERIAIVKQLVKEKLSGKGEPKEKAEAKEPEKKKEPAEKKTDEPQPNREVGNRGTGPNDLAADAVRRGSFRDFDREQTRKYAQRGS